MGRDIDITEDDIEFVADLDDPIRGRVVFRGYEVRTARMLHVEKWPLLRADAERSRHDQIDAFSAHEIIEFRRMTEE